MKSRKGYKVIGGTATRGRFSRPRPAWILMILTNVFGLCVRSDFGVQNCQRALNLNGSESSKFARHLKRYLFVLKEPTKVIDQPID